MSGVFNPEERRRVSRGIGSERYRPQQDSVQKEYRQICSDIAWSPDSSSVALLSYTGEIDLWPWGIMALWAGHPFFDSTFYLEIYDLSGKLIYNATVPGWYKMASGHTRGRLVWLP